MVFGLMELCSKRGVGLNFNMLFCVTGRRSGVNGHLSVGLNFNMLFYVTGRRSGVNGHLSVGLNFNMLFYITGRRSGVNGHLSGHVASDSHLDLSRAPYVLYGVKYIDLVSLGANASDPHLDLGRAPYVLYGVKYIDPVSPKHHSPPISNSYIAPPFFFNGPNLDLGCVLISDPGTLGTGAKIRLHTPNAVTYHTNTAPL